MLNTFDITRNWAGARDIQVPTNISMQVGQPDLDYG
jgi:hypothetical protein